LTARLGPIYTTDNLSISGTHTHSGPAGFLQYVLYQVTSLGWVKETFDAWVNGISESIIMAHNSMQPGKILINQGKLYDANINRSPSSYLENPQEERDLYPEGDTDKTMLLLKFVSETGKTLGVLNWFAVHATSMNNTNTLVSGDNKGYAEYAMEKEANGPESVPGMGPFVAAFASSNLGDVSPNTNGPKCLDTGLPCDFYHSTCNGRTENCVAFGPGTNGDIFESTKIIGDKQYTFAKKLMNDAVEELSGPVDFRHTFVNMPKLEVTLEDGSKTTLCGPAMGYAFAAGTTDGPGMFGFTQGTTSGNPFWDKVAAKLSEPTPEEIACQAPKPILINTGDMNRPYEWDPKIAPIQVFRVGNLFIVSLPGELTTMSGRRMRKVVADLVTNAGLLPKGQQAYVTIAGLANNYASYVATYEEYQAQRYEAASTIYGPYTLAGYMQEVARITTDMINGSPSASGESYPDLTDVQLQGMPEVKIDLCPNGTSYGDVVKGKDVLSTPYTAGTDSVKVTFISANPRNNQKIQGTYLTVEKQQSNGKTYKTVATDGDWETKFYWQGGINDPLAFQVVPFSTATVTWEVPATASEGIYRICHQGDHKIAKVDKTLPFSGCSSTFQVMAAKR